MDLQRKSSHNKDMQFLNAHFTKNKSAESFFSWENRNISIQSTEGRLLFSQKNVEAPSTWSSLAVEIAASKYFRKEKEKSVRKMARRVVSAIQKEGLKQKYFKNKKQARIFSKELKFILLSQKAFFNSPVWFNCGLFESYKIKSKAQLWAWNRSKNKVEPSLFSYERPQVSACFIQSVEDSLESIFELAKNEAKIFKFGSGSGTNFSKIRSRYEKLEGGGFSSGLISFLEVLDKGAASIKSGGTTRRAAKMVVLDIDHPEIDDFINWKMKEERKAKALIQDVSYWKNQISNHESEDLNFVEEAYRTVSGQNSNNSVRVNKEFLKAVKENKNWNLIARGHNGLSGDSKNINQSSLNSSRSSKQTIRNFKASDLWDQIIQSAWFCADPGLQFKDTIQSWNTCASSGEIRSSNPCSEFLFLDNSACNLASLNLLQFLNEKKEFQIEDFLHTVRIIFLAQEILIDYAGYPTSEICQNSHDFRPLGIGLSGLGAFLMRLEIPYDSEEGRAWGAALSALLTGESYRVSSEFAKEKGSFTHFKKNKKSMLSVIQKHQRSLGKIDWNLLPTELKFRNKEIWDQTLKSGMQFGYRNAQVSVQAPTGTIGLVMDSETTGIEPEFSLIKTKSFTSGFKKESVNPSFMKFLEEKYSLKDQKKVLSFLKQKGTVQGCSVLTTLEQKIFECAMDLSKEGHLFMMAAVQPFISGAISKTVNIPEFATVKDVSDIYLKAYELGLKSISIYRNGSKSLQPLSVSGRETQNRIDKESGVEDIQNNSSGGNSDFQAPICSECGQKTEISGGCFRCLNCGAVVGCS